MPHHVKSSAALVLGMLTGMVLTAFVEALGHVVYPPPEGMDPRQQHVLRNDLRTAPVGVLVFLLAAWAIGPFCGAWVAVRLQPGHRMWPAWLLGGLFLLGGIVNLWAVPHPLWVSGIGVLEFLPCAWLGGRLAQVGQLLDDVDSSP
jgi:hypothetical protein